MATDLEKRNYSAVMQALKEQNNKLETYNQKIVALQTQVNTLVQELNELKKKNMEDLVAKFNSGPTAVSHGNQH